MKKIHFLRNLKPKLIIAFAFILIIPSVLIGIGSFTSAKQTIQNELLSSIDDNLDILNLTIDGAFKPKLNDSNILASQFNATNVQDENKEEVNRIFEQYIELHPEVEAIYVSRPDGSVIIYPHAELSDDFDARERSWYKDAMTQKGQAVISDPYVSAANQEVVVTISQSTADGSGAIGIDLKMGNIQELANQIEIGDEGYALILDQNGHYVSHPKNPPGTEATETFYQNLYQDVAGIFHYELDGKPKMMSYDTNELTGWKVAGNIYTDEISDAASPILYTTLVIIVVALVAGAILIYFIIRSIVTPIKDLKETAVKVSNGDLTQIIQVKTTDEIGQLGQAFVGMQENLKILLRNIEQNAEQVASSAQQLTASTEETSAATEQVSTSIQQVALSVEKQKESEEKSVQVLGKISDGAQHIVENATKVSQLSREATKQAEYGGESVGKILNQMETIRDLVLDSNKIMQSLTERSKEIDSILKIISGISEQTNLLSLNASIEAARAGEHGKGFAVVAQEVKKLAEQSHASTNDIQAIISAIQSETTTSLSMMKKVTSAVESGVEVSNEAVTKFYHIMESLNNVTPQMLDVSDTVNKVSVAIKETTDRANENAIIAESNAAASEQVAASAQEQLAAMEEISSSAQALTEMAEELRLVISKFKY
nr:methyl-accepting chemotaxis protein [Lysinibacillus timonensis]